MTKKTAQPQELAILTELLKDLNWPHTSSTVAALASNLRAPVLDKVPAAIPLGTLASSVASHILSLKEEVAYHRQKTTTHGSNENVKRPRGYRRPDVPVAYAPFVTEEDLEATTGDQAWENYESVYAALMLACRVYLALCQDHTKPGEVVLMKDGRDDTHVVLLPPGTNPAALWATLKPLRRFADKVSDGGDPVDEFIFAELAMRGFTSRKPRDDIPLYPYTSR